MLVPLFNLKFSIFNSSSFPFPFSFLRRCKAPFRTQGRGRPARGSIFSVQSFILFQGLNKLTDFMHLSRYAYSLWTVRLTLSASYAVVCLTCARHGTIQPYEVFVAQFPVLFVHLQARQRTVVLAFVIVHEDARYIDAVRAGHAVFTVIAWYGLQPHYLLGNGCLQVLHLNVGKRFQWTVGEEVVLQVFHKCHA